MICKFRLRATIAVPRMTATFALVVAILAVGHYNPARSAISVTSAGGRPSVPTAKPPKPPVFQLYRYQILPLDVVQDSLFDQPIPIEELLEQKNEIFADALRSIKTWEYPKGEIIYRFEGEDRDAFLLRMGVRRTVTLHTRDFDERETEDWPGIVVAIDNDPEVQKTAIQLDFRVFRHTQTVARILEDNLNRALRKDNLSVYFEPLFERSDFWKTVERYPNQILRASFDLISPNMSNISGELNLDLAELHKNTNTKRTKLELNSDRGTALQLTPKDPTVNSLVNYASDGGGEISLKIVGLKRKIKTSQSIKETSFQELRITGRDEKQIGQIARDILE